MNVDDPRHGTNAGHVAGCRQECCRAAKLRYDKRRKWEASQGIVRRVPVWHVTRRIGALQRIGWSVPRIAENCPTLSAKTIYGLDRVDSVYVTTFREIAEVYERLCMIPVAASTPGATRTKRYAERMGFPPPLAWDDIDSPDETPTDWAYVPASRTDRFRELATQGVTVSEACRRLRIGQNALEKWAERHGLRDLYADMCGREDGIREWKNQYSKGAA